MRGPIGAVCSPAAKDIIMTIPAGAVITVLGGGSTRFLATEFCHEAVLGLRGEGYGTEDERAAVLESNWQAIRERGASLSGRLIWCRASP